MIISRIINKGISKLKKGVKNCISPLLNTKIYITNDKENYLLIPSSLDGFMCEKTITEVINNGASIYHLYGKLKVESNDCLCPNCNKKMHIHDSRNISLRHFCFGNNQTIIHFKRYRFQCRHCGYSKMQNIPFKSDKHFITKSLQQYIEDLLATGNFTLKEVARLTKVNRNIIKDIDSTRLFKKYVIDNSLIRPENITEFLGIDEFKLHDGRRYATHIIDLKTGHILWIAEGKNKQIVYDFIDHVGLEWMSNVKAVACDMNAGFANAFVEKCPHIKIVFDHFHLIKNFNEIVVNNVYKEEEIRLRRENRTEEANTLKNSKYILYSSRDTLKRKDKEVKNGKIIQQGSEIFKTQTIIRKGSYEEKYNGLLKDNELLIMIDLIKEKLNDMYKSKNSKQMKKRINDIISLCNETNDKYFIKYGELLKSHIDGIANYADYNISSGKIEGINNKIKTIRRQHYGLPDDTYFFLKLMDMSRA